MLSTDEAQKILEDSGIEVIKKPDPDDIFKDQVFIGNEIIWDKLISQMKTIERLKGLLDSIPHFKWIQAILNKYNPKLEIVEIKIDGKRKQAYGIAFKEIIDKKGKVPNLDKCFHYLFMLIQTYMGPLFEPFEYNDSKDINGSSN